MNPVQSGGLLIGIALVLNLVGRLLTPAVQASGSVPLAALLTALMLVSLVLGVFGLVRLIRGLLGPRR